MRDLLSIGTSRGCEMIGTGIGLGLSGFMLNSPWNPTKLDGLKFWVDASDSSTLFTDSTLTTLAVADGDPIGGWKDKSGLGLNLTQSDSLYKPSLKFSRQNGRNGINFSEKAMKTAIATAITSPTIFVVAKNTTYTNVVPYIFDNPTTNNLSLYTAQSDSKLYFDAGTTLGSSNATTLGTAFQTTLKLNNPRTSSELRINAISTIGSVGNNNWAGFTLGSPGHNNASIYKLNGDIYEVLVYNSPLSSSNVLLVEAYLKTKWGTP
jgi:hypothetical protein